MEAEKWKLVEELFATALAQPAETRAQFLDEACPEDRKLREEVLSLLNSDDTAGSFLEDAPAAPIDRYPQLRGGDKLGHFEILELIGRGGMGEVYRARDSRLKRDVAIKVLPAGFASDARSVLRFRFEARAASSLNHPNIVQIFEIGQQDGRFWIVSELVHGQSLRQVIEHGPLPARRAIEIATQIADGLAAAHAAGIIHRDLSPANIMLTAGYRVKLLDFGVAKRVDAVPVTSESLAGLTIPGLIIGSPGYLAPEQITGQGVDYRSDIFALGVVLHEMLSGKRAFNGNSTVEMLSANLRNEPPALPSSVPLPLRRITERCLEKHPEKRFQSAADLGFALAILSEGGISAPVSLKRISSPKSIIAAMAVAASIALGSYWIAVQVHRRTSSAGIMRRLTADAGLTSDGAISADGKLVAFASDRASPDNLDIWIRQIDAGGPPVRLTTDSADDYDPAFSPDGTRIAFRSERDGGGIYQIPTLGGDARLLVPQGRRPRFSPDGRFLMYWTGLGSRGTPTGDYGAKLFVQPISGGARKEVSAYCSDISASAVWSPDSRYILFLGHCNKQLSVWIYSLDGRALQPSVGVFQYLSANLRRLPSTEFTSSTELNNFSEFIFHDWVGNPSRLFLSRFAGDMVSIAVLRITEDGLHVAGTLQNLTFGTGTEYRESIAANGRMVISGVNTNFLVWGLPINESGEATSDPVQLSSEQASGTTLSRNGDILGSQWNPGKTWEIRTTNLRTGNQNLVSEGEGAAGGATMNASGTNVAFEIDRPPNFTLWQAPTFGGLPQKLLDTFFYPTDWSIDSRFLLGVADSEPRPEITILNVETKERHKFLVDPAGRSLWQAHFSNNGQWVTFNALWPGHSQLYIAPFRMGAVSRNEWIPITDGNGWDDKPHFSHSDKLLFFTSDRDGHRCIWAQRLTSDMHPAGNPFTVYHFHRSRRSIENSGIEAMELGVGPKMLVFNQQEFTGNIWLLDTDKK